MRENSIFLSIIIPVYNINFELLTASLRSVVSGRNESIEIIIVDDGSTNGAGEICDQFEDKKNNIFVYHQENQGVSVARNLGIEKAHGEYIAFVDSDDTVKMDTILSVAQYAAKGDNDICYFMYRRDKNFTICSNIDSAGIKVTDINSLIYNIASQNEPYQGYSIGSPWGKVFKRLFLIHNNLRFLASLRKMQDRVFMMYCLMKNPKVDFVSAEGYCYVRNEESIVNNYNPRMGGYLSKVGIEIVRFNETYKCLNKAQINTIRCKLLNEFLGLDILHRNNPKTEQEKISNLQQFIKDNNINDALKNYYSHEFNRNERIKIVLVKCHMYRALIKISKVYSNR